MEDIQHMLSLTPKNEREVIHHLVTGLVNEQLIPPGRDPGGPEERVIIDTYYTHYWNFWLSWHGHCFMAMLSSYYDEKTRSFEICPASDYGLKNRKFLIANPTTEASAFIRLIIDTVINSNESSRLRRSQLAR